MKFQHPPRPPSLTSDFECHFRSVICKPFSFYSYTRGLFFPLSFIFLRPFDMPLPTILEHEPTSLSETTIQENPRASSLLRCARKSEAKFAKASASMAALPSPITPCSRPLTPDSLFGEITDPQNVACPVPDEAIPPIFIHCMNCWRKDHRESM